MSDGGHIWSTVLSRSMLYLCVLCVLGMSKMVARVVSCKKSEAVVGVWKFGSLVRAQGFQFPGVVTKDTLCYWVIELFRVRVAYVNIFSFHL